MTRYTVLVVGGGGREHAICWKLAQSDHVDRIYLASENPGAEQLGKVESVSLNVKDNKGVAEWCKKNGISLVIVGPEDPLANGLGDALKNVGVPCFGPEQQAAQIETDKNWAKLFMDRHKIPTARWKGFTDANEAKNFVNRSEFPALVVKAAGLAAGKGVVVASDKVEACQAIDEILVQKKFGSAGKVVVVEELLVGEEVSVLAFTDGRKVVPLMPAQDHKRIFNGDEGLNTGGMGAYCPCPLLSHKDAEFVKKNILQTAVDGLKAENIPFIGVLYAGIILTKEGPKVLEFNCRFGDPETQVILPLLKSDLFLAMKACYDGTLTDSHISWHTDVSAVGVILASRGYPETSSKGQVITNVDKISLRHNHFVFHSGTKFSPKGELLTNGGRVLIAVSLAPSLAQAAARATVAAEEISFDGKQFRTDIAHKGIASVCNKTERCLGLHWRFWWTLRY
ncbi:trifunctional purine biosynthetic protein adenosine-3 isoform X2 [Athalia rosae]|uniref:trifunctional purine biosynthetic protein adenosine-3 isoform X2 n=1 Tax=Athalia rosae TaxID=37344 RepID=UPI0020345095|nr:trifunctional purine biosynthetic protein adenosine-3 isoform X2 [Athalia rosae]